MKIRQWILILIGAALLALVIRVFLFETIRVAGLAMTQSQESGDRLFVEKWTLGARMPMTIGLPFTADSLFKKPTYVSLGEKAIRTHAFGKIKRNDLLAFNDPTSKLKLERAPILLSRCVGLPGEEFHLSKGVTNINGIKIPRHQDVSYCYSYPLSLQKSLEQVMKSCKIKRPVYQDKDSGFVYLTRHEWYRLFKLNDQVDLSLRLRFSGFDEQKIHIPVKGDKIEMNAKTFDQYGELINRYEGVQLSIDTAGNILKNGHKIQAHTFKENYYFILNDNQGFLNDSRSFGLLPERYIIGKAWMVLFSPSSKRFLEKF